jgi:hypothetical protein
VLAALIAFFFYTAVAAQELTGAAAVADAVLWGVNPMPRATQTRDLSADVQTKLAEYRSRQEAFRTALKPAPNATTEEREVFEKRVGVERVIFCLFPRRDSAKIAASYASDADLSYEWENEARPPRAEAAFIDSLLRDLPQPWLAPYLNLIAGHRKLCASQMEGPATPAQRDEEATAARRQLTRARDAGHPVIRIVADHLMTTGRCLE